MDSITSHQSFFDRAIDPLNMEEKKLIKEVRNQSNNTFSSREETSESMEAAPVLEEAKNPSRLTCAGAFVRFFTQKKFGTWDGVYLSCLLSMFGVIMFLRLGYIVGQAGIWQTWLIELISAAIVLITTLSMSALCTNGTIKQGGAYYLISRSLGPEIGGSVGILFTLGNSVAVALHILGFVEPLIFQLKTRITGSLKNDLRVLGLGTLLVLLVFAFIGVGWMIKMQIIIFIMLMATIVCFFVGCFLTSQMDFYVVGIGNGAFRQNLNPAYSPGLSFINAFGIFFPAMTGIMAGANLSGDLKNPSKSIPVGTLSAVITAATIYILMSTFLGDSVLRGPLYCDMKEPLKGICYNLIVEKVTVPGIMVYVGIYAATLSSALASLVGAPRILTTVGDDKLLRVLNIFGVKRSNGEPLYSYIPVAVIAACCIAIADLNLIAQVVTIVYMITYCLINFACFQSSVSQSPGWRPTFKMYNKWVALLGFIICLCLVFILDYIIAIPTMLLSLAIIFFIYWKNPDINWGSANQSFSTMAVIRHLKYQRKQEDHIKNFRPNFMIFTSDCLNDLKLIQFSQTLRHAFGANFLGVVKTHSQLENASNRDLFASEKSDFFEIESFERRSPSVFFRKDLVWDNYYDGCALLLKLTGIARIKPNTVVIKHDIDWRKNKENAKSYFSFLIQACDSNNALMIGLNFHLLSFDHCDPFGTVDIWWLYDDGGFSLLIPHILCKSLFWQKNTQGPTKVPLRLFVISNNEEIAKADINLLLQHVRLEDIEVISVYPQTSEKESFGKRWESVAVLMREHSKKAKLVFCTMPSPSEKQKEESFLGMFDIVAQDMPAIIMIRGGGEKVLTWNHE